MLAHRALVAAAVFFTAGLAHAQDFPNRTITLVVPYAAGGGLDATARLIAEPMGRALGQSVIVENRPGANGQVGVSSVAQAQPDGYTVLFSNGSPMTITPHLADITYDPIADFEPITTLITNDLLIAVTGDFPAQTYEEFEELVRSEPGRYLYSSAGLGGESHLAMELYQAATGLEMRHVPFAGDGAAIPNVLNGDVPVMITAYNSIQQYVAEGQIRPIVTLGSERMDRLPDTPTMVEEGEDSLVVGAWFGVYAPLGTDAEIVAALNAAFHAALEDPAVVQRIDELGMRISPSTPEELTQKLVDENARWEQVIRDANITLE
ncbi:Bug family tripartite tricarboxylate transporter substrate binding protein [Pelagibacterium lacus]|uniref:Tripartite tricarboxylate transporter substrate binding protein n=1 Tax=Pelagibacterium lacus TaxID=2282655 RepID=A0A369W7F9_9HYPH|nr:tripartite tricarboxylate transporter substrate binding protein [Pelagibacterium lacus]RDE10528.1 tripartite tricarboxylate transporter substrate binding protein [Pelagibacterium lacus]